MTVRGGVIHNKWLVGPVERALRGSGFFVQREVPTGPGRDAGFVDLLAERGSTRWVVEAERTCERLARDVDKAVALQAQLLLVVTPTARDARRVGRRLRELRPGRLPCRVCVLPLGVVLQRLAQKSDLMSRRYVPRDIKSKKSPHKESH